jgi:tetratricopeptide (TPR) repeat protein
LPAPPAWNCEERPLENSVKSPKSSSLKNRFYAFGHSGYFEPFGEAESDADRLDAFMRRQWVPLLASDAPVADRDVRRAGVLTPFEHFLLDKADPIKLLGYAAILFALVWYVGAVPYRDRAVALAREQLAQEHTDAIAERAFRAMQDFGDVVTGDANLQTRADLSPTRKKLLETAQKLFDGMVDQLPDAREMGEGARRALAKAHIEIARLTSEIGGLDSRNIGSAIKHFEFTIEILSQLPSGDPLTQWVQAQAYKGLGEADLNRLNMEGGGDPARAKKSLTDAREMLDTLGPQTVQALKGDYHRMMAWTWIDQGALDPGQAAFCYDQAKALLGRPDPSRSAADVGVTDDYAWLLMHIATLQRGANKLQDARENVIEARTIFEKLANAGEPAPTRIENLAWSLHDLGLVELDLFRLGRGNPAEVLADLEKARDRFKDLVDRKFKDRSDRYNLGLASTYKDLAEAIRQIYPRDDVRRREEAREALNRAIVIYGYDLTPATEDDVMNSRAWAEYALGWILVDLHYPRRNGSRSEAESAIIEALKQFDRACTLRPRELEFSAGRAWCLVTLGEWRQSNQAKAEASERYQQAQQEFQKVRAVRPQNDRFYQEARDGVDRCEELLRAMRSAGRAAAPARVRPAAAQAPARLRRVAAQAPPDVKIELGRRAIIARPSGTAEPPVPVFRDGNPLQVDPAGRPARFKIVEIYENATTTRDFPLIWADLVSIGYFRSTYQKPEGPGARMGTPVVGAPSFRPASEPLKFIPQVTRADLTVGGPDHLRVKLAARFSSQADVEASRTYPPTAAGRSTMDLTVKFVARESIKLDRDLRGFDAFRLLTLSSMFASIDQYDANLLRYEERGATVRTLQIDRSTRRNARLLPRGVELGSWFELIKTPGSRWFPDSPSIRVELAQRAQVPGRLGIQGYLVDSDNPNDDSLSVWVEWLDAPELLAPGTTLGLGARVIATPPA